MNINLTIHTSQLDLFKSLYNITKHEYKDYNIEIFENKKINTNIVYQYESSTSCLLNLEDSNEEFQIEKAVLIRHSGDEMSWQHFIQDAIPLFTNDLIKLLRDDITIRIILPNILPHHIFIIKEILELKNEIICVFNGIIIKKLYIPIFTPVNKFINCIIPSKYRLSIANKIQSKLTLYNQQYVLYLTRRGLCRNPDNEKEITSFLEKYANDQNLKFINFDANNYSSVKERFELFHNSQIIIAPHGGSIFHMYACKPGTKFIEFVSIEGNPICDSNKLAPYLGLEYKVLLVNGSHSGPGYNVNMNKLIELLDNTNVTVIKRDNNYFNLF